MEITMCSVSATGWANTDALSLREYCLPENLTQLVLEKGTQTEMNMINDVLKLQYRMVCTGVYIMEVPLLVT